MKTFDITIAGDINLDLILYGLPQKMPLERELLASNFQLTLGGSSSILAHNLAALGRKVGFVGKIGADEMGQVALQRLQQVGVDVSHCIQANDLKTGVTILLHHGSNRHIMTYLGTIAELAPEDLDIDYLANARHFHVSAFFLQKKLQNGLPDVCRNLRSRGLTVSLDTNDDPDDQWGEAFTTMLPVIDILFPNEDEAKRMAKRDDLNEAIDWLAERVPIVVVKCGSRGAIVQQKDRRWSVPTMLEKPVDTIGAGDSFNAGFLSRFVEGASLEECAAMGNRTAALSTLRPGGTESFRDTELLRRLQSDR
ncbi:carbohydrate kinase family protein [Edaphobacter albus]|uniref:carbohydrate kinase family protein n=1 Tax=Edaphobacter sp. 4G125 TaxID=2763071 RepID=UPI00164505CA|nr:carbohydrate kinase family protein [Edaphobacter sp. 4G125]QNI35955.1 carbohydrate kinase family protein [Edaphobacter sp. 4G125]